MFFHDAGFVHGNVWVCLCPVNIYGTVSTITGVRIQRCLAFELSAASWFNHELQVRVQNQTDHHRFPENVLRCLLNHVSNLKSCSSRFTNVMCNPTAGFPGVPWLQGSSFIPTLGPCTKRTEQFQSHWNPTGPARFDPERDVGGVENHSSPAWLAPSPSLSSSSSISGQSSLCRSWQPSHKVASHLSQLKPCRPQQECQLSVPSHSQRTIFPSW